jgi:hypothetical protein
MKRYFEGGLNFALNEKPRCGAPIKSEEPMFYSKIRTLPIIGLLGSVLLVRIDSAKLYKIGLLIAI